MMVGRQEEKYDLYSIISPVRLAHGEEHAAS